MWTKQELEITITLLCWVVGAGMLGLPQAMAMTGLEIGLVILVVVAGLNTIASVFLVKCMVDMPEDIQTFKDLANEIMGPIGANVAFYSQQLSCLGSCVLQLTLTAGMMQKLADTHLVNNLNINQWILVAFVVVTPPCLVRGFKDLAILSLLGTIGSFGTAFMILYESVRQYDGEAIYGAPKAVNIAKAFCIINICFGAGSIIPPLQQKLTDRRSMQKVVLLCLPLTALLYAALALSPGLTFGCHVHDNILMSLGNHTGVKIALMMLVVHFILSFPVVLIPVFEVLEQHLQFNRTAKHYTKVLPVYNHNAKTTTTNKSIDINNNIDTLKVSLLQDEPNDINNNNSSNNNDQNDDCDKETTSPSASPASRTTAETITPSQNETTCVDKMRRVMCCVDFPAFKSVALRVFVLALCTFVSEVIPFFDDILALLGATTMALQSLILPGILYLLRFPRAHTLLRLLALTVVVCGLVAGVWGTYVATESMIHKASSYRLFQVRPLAAGNCNETSGEGCLFAFCPVGYRSGEGFYDSS